jgi:hypothetical protein
VTVDGLTEPAELAEFARLEGDPVEGLEIRDGALAPSDSPGLGVHRVNDHLEKGTP